MQDARLAAWRIVLREPFRYGDLATEEALVVAQELTGQRRKLLEVSGPLLVRIAAVSCVGRLALLISITRLEDISVELRLVRLRWRRAEPFDSKLLGQMQRILGLLGWCWTLNQSLMHHCFDLVGVVLHRLVDCTLLGGCLRLAGNVQV